MVISQLPQTVEAEPKAKPRTHDPQPPAGSAPEPPARAAGRSPRIATEWLLASEASLVATIDIGTYRAADGSLLHVRQRQDGELVVEVERERGCRGPLDAAHLVKLSDDPYWPDLEPAITLLG